MNRFAYYALKCEDGDFASCTPVENCSFAGGTEFTFGMDFYWNGHEGVFFRQEEGVCCWISDEGEIHWESGAGWEICTSALTSPLAAEEWSHLDVVYEKSQATLYLNGVQTETAALSGQTQAGSGKYRFLEDGRGYLRNLRIVDHSMTQQEITDNLLQTRLDPQNLWLWLPFDSSYAQDKGKYQKKVSYPGLCRCETLVKSLTFSGKGYALLDQVAENPGSGSLTSFSVAMRIFSTPCGADSVTLFENSGEKDGFRICLKERQTRLAVEWGQEQKILDSLTVPYYQWTDMAVSVDQGEIQVYLKGEEAGRITLSTPYSRTSGPRLCLGDGFTGYMDYLALYDHPLTADEAAQIHAVEPYVFDSGISLLYLFHGEPRQNFLGKGTLLLQQGVQLSLVEGTVYEETIEPIQFRTRSTFSISAFSQWEADILADVATKFTSTATGQGSCTLDPGAMEFFWEGLKDSAAAQNLFLDYNAITDKEILSLMKTAASQEVSLSVLSTVAAQGTSVGVLTVSADKVMEFQLALGTAMGLSYMLKVATETKTKTKEPESPPAPDPEPEPETGYTVELVSIQFCNGKEGSLPLREDYDKNQALPEWSASSSGEAICAYAAGKQSPKVKFSFRYQPAKDQPPVSLRLGFRSDFLGECLSGAKTCGSAGVYEVEAACDKNQLEQAKMGQRTEALRCFSQEGGRDHMLRTAEVKIHTLCHKPVSPWNPESQDEAPLIPLLRAAGEIAAAASAPVGEEETYLNAAADWLAQKTDWSLQGENKYSSSFELGKVPFCGRRFVEDFCKGSLTAGPLDYYLFIAHLGAMEGLTLYVYELANMEQLLEQDGVPVIDSGGIIFNEEYRVFGKPCPQNIIRSCLISPQLAENGLYWDLLIQSSSMPSGWKRTSWDDYRAKAISWACYVYEPYALEGWMDTEELPKQPLGIAYIVNQQKFIPTWRKAFKKHISQMYKYPDNKACCHRVSYKTIENILLSTFNQLKSGRIGHGEMVAILELLSNGFYPRGEPDLNVDQDEYQNYQELMEAFAFLSSKTGEMLQSSIECVETAKKLDIALKCLNSAKENLREGYSSWNCSIGENFDPVSWEFVTLINGVTCMVLTQEGPCEQRQDERKKGIYLNDQDDGRFIDMLQQIEKALDRKLFRVSFVMYKMWDQEKNTWRRWVAARSSKNEFQTEDVISVITNVKKFYFNPRLKEWGSLPTL